MSENEINILFTGDFCPVNRIEKLALGGKFGAIFNDFIDILHGNDLNVTDLECPLTVGTSCRKKIGPHQKAHPECIEALKCGDIGLVALANNHIMDYGSEGISDTLRLCKSKDINFVGVGSSPEKASEPFTMVIKNRRIAIFNYAENEFISASDGDWNCNPIDNQNMYYDLHQAREANDFIFVFVHAGNEYFKLPSPRLQRLFRYLVDLGADAVIASHTHVFSGYEIYKSKPIFYGLGNFIYDWPGKRNMEWNRGFGVKFSLSERVDFELIPFLQGNEQPGVFCLNNIERDEFFREINMLNKMISDEKMLESEFTKNCRSIFPMYDGYIEPYFGKFISKLRHLGFFPRLMGKRKRLLLLNIIRCESHRDVLLKILGQYE